MVSTIRINGAVVYTESLQEKLEAGIADAKEALNGLSREARRSPNFKKVTLALSFLGTIAFSSLASAQAINPNIQNETLTSNPFGFMLDKLKGKLLDTPLDLHKENSMISQLNEYMANHLLTTHNFFGDPSILGIYNAVWQIVLSFVVLIISKKGFDMVKARVVGGQSQGATEFITRLLASALMSFLTLDIIGLGINLSNMATGVIMKAMTHGNIHFSSMLAGIADGSLSTFFWMISYIVLFAILAVRYWMRQINLVILGCLAPIANMAWVTDGGAMVGTLIREVIMSIATPVVQAMVLGIGTTILLQAGNIATVGFLNSMFIGISTMVIMITVPDFLRKFTTGSVNPLTAGLKIYNGIRTFPAGLIKGLKK